MLPSNLDTAELGTRDNWRDNLTHVISQQNVSFRITAQN